MTKEVTTIINANWILSFESFNCI